MHKVYFLVALIPLTVLSCMTTKPAQRPVERRTKVRTGLSTERAPTPSYQPPDDNVLIQATKRWSDEKYQWNQGDDALLSAIPFNPASGSLPEAALTLGAIHRVLSPSNQSLPKFKEEELKPVIPAPNASTVAKPMKDVANPDQLNLEKASSFFGVDIASALENNLLLRRASVYKMAFRALDVAPTSDPFKQKLNALLNSELSAWKDLAVRTAPAQQPVPLNLVTSSPFPSPSATPVAAYNSQPVVAPVVDTQDNSTLIKDAQSLADAGQFQAAIKKLESVPSSSSQYGEAQNRIKVVSSAAVQDIRKKAAADFQAAMPVSDTKVKKSYLEKARDRLKEAVEQYPQASNMDTVKDNLEVVEKELARLD